MAVAFAADDARPQEARDAEQGLLGSDDEETRFLACQPFTRELAATGSVGHSLDSALTEAGVPAAARLEARQALAAVIDIARDVAAGDRFYVRYEQAFTAEGALIGVGRALWVELGTRAKGTISLHRFRSSGGGERFWLASGEAATPPSMRLPLDVLTVSSGYGLRADPLDKPGPALAIGPLPDRPPSPAAATVAPAALPQPVAAPQPEQPRPAARNSVRGSLSAGQFGFGGGPAAASLDPGRLEHRLAIERAAQARHAAEAAAAASAKAAAAAAEQAVAAAPRPAPRARVLFMHDGVDLVAPTGTPIYAASDGVVVGASPNGGYGNWIRIDHPGKLSTVYGHLSEFAPGIEAGSQVSQGELIGFVGNTGRSTGSHLHFEILSDGKAADPLVHPEIKRAQLRGADLERFRKHVKRAHAERSREMAVELSSAGF